MALKILYDRINRSLSCTFIDGSLNNDANQWVHLWVIDASAQQVDGYQNEISLVWLIGRTPEVSELHSVVAPVPSVLYRFIMYDRHLVARGMIMRSQSIAMFLTVMRTRLDGGRGRISA